MKNKKSLKLNLYLFYLLENLKKRYCNISLILFYIEVITWLRLWYREIKIVSNLSAIKNTNLYWSIEIINKCCFHTRFLVKQQQVYFLKNLPDQDLNCLLLQISHYCKSLFVKLSFFVLLFHCGQCGTILYHSECGCCSCKIIL
jgi:hypothetical protein